MEEHSDAYKNESEHVMFFFSLALEIFEQEVAW